MSSTPPAPAAPSVERTAEVERLLATLPGDGRDAAWTAAFYAAVTDASLAAGEPQSFVGPDGFPYGNLRLPPMGEPFEAWSVALLAGWATENGAGVVVHDRGGGAAWVFRYGELWSLRSRGTLDATPPDDDGRARTLERAEQVLVGQPTDEVVPPWARATLRAALEAAGVDGPRIAWVARADGHPRFSVALDLPADEQAAHRITWYLPPDYGLLPATAVGADSLQPL